MRLVRWLLMIPAAVAAWYTALALGLAIHMGLDALCPPEQVISGFCVAPWYGAASAMIVCVGAALAAALILLACTLLAPSHKRQIAIATFVLGAGVASLMGFSAKAFGPMLTAIVTGALVLWVLMRRLAPVIADNGIQAR